MPRFADTNVVLYWASTAPDESAKSDVAAGLLAAGDLVLSTQVLTEFYVNAVRATGAVRAGEEHAAALVESLTRFHIEPLTVQIVRAAIATSRRYKVSYWDAAIIEAARSAGCDEVLSEDLNDGQDFGGVRVVNPFAGIGGSVDPR